MPSRQRFDPLATSTNPRWLVVTDMLGQLITVTSLAPRADLRAALRSAIDAYATDGWQAEGDGHYAFVFIRRGGERCMLNLTSVDPDMAPGAGHAFLAGRGGSARGASGDVTCG